MSVDWNDTVTINIFLSASPPARQSFGKVLILVDKATNTLNGQRTAEYANPTEVAAALTAGYIASGVAGWLNDVFAQRPTPASILVGNHNTAGSETLAAALTAIRAVDDTWYGSAIYTRVAADIQTWAELIESLEKIFVGQSADASWLDSGIPAGLSTIAGNERTAVSYHDVATEASDLCWLVSRLVYDPDVQSAGWEGEVLEVLPLATALTTAQRNFVTTTNKANVGLPYSSADFYMSPGQNMNGRAFYEIVTADWFRARCREDISLLKLQFTQRGQKIIVDRTGQALILGILRTRLQQGEAAGHFVKGQTRATAEAITAQDLEDRKLRFKVEAQIAADARLFTVNVYLQSGELEA